MNNRSSLHLDEQDIDIAMPTCKYCGEAMGMILYLGKYMYICPCGKWQAKEELDEEQE